MDKNHWCGTIKGGQELIILGPSQHSQAINNDGDEKENETVSSTKKRVNSIIMMIVNKPETMSECPAGNICGLMGIDEYLTKSDTLADTEQVFPFKTMRFIIPNWSFRK